MTRVRSVTVAADTGLSSPYEQEFTLPLAGMTPKLCRVLLWGATGSGHTGNARGSEGWCDGTTEACVGARSFDAAGIQNNSDTDRFASVDIIGGMPAPASQTLVDTLEFVSFSANKVKLRWNGGSSAPSAAWRVQVSAWAGDDFEAEVLKFSITSGSDALNTAKTISLASAWRPKVLRFVGHNDAIASASNNWQTTARMGAGWAYDDGSSISQWAWGFEWENATGVVDVGLAALLSMDSTPIPRCLAFGEQNGTQTYGELELSATRLNGTSGLGEFDVTPRFAVNTMDGIAVAMSSGRRAHLGMHTILGTNDSGPTSVSITSPGWRVQWIDHVATNIALPGFGSGNLYGAVPWAGTVDRDDTVGQFYEWTQERRNTNNVDSSSYFSARYGAVRTHDELESYLLQFDGFTTTGWDFSILTQASGKKLSMWAAFEAEPESTVEDAETEDVAVAILTRVRSANETAQASDTPAALLARTRTTDESASTADAIAALLGRIRTTSESLQSADAVAALLGRIRITNESTATADAVAAVLARLRSVVETLQSADAALALLGLVRSVLEGAETADVAAAVRGLARSVEEQAHAADAVLATIGLARAVAEDAETAETLAAILGLVRSTEEVGEVADVAAAWRGLTRAAAEDSAVADALARVLGLARTEDEAAEAADAAAALLGLVRAPAAEGTEAEDAALSVLGLARSLSEAAEAADAALALRGAFRTTVEAAVASDAATRVLGALRAALEAAETGDAVLAALGLVRAASEALSTAEAAAARRGLVRAVTESAAAADAVLAALGLVRAAGESAQTADLAAALIGVVRVPAAEAAQAADTVLALVGVFRAVEESALAADTAAGFLALVRGLSEPAEAAESIARALGLVRTPAEPATTADVARAFIGGLRSVLEASEAEDAIVALLGRFRGAVEASTVSDVATYVLDTAQPEEALVRRLGIARELTLVLAIATSQTRRLGMCTDSSQTLTLRP